MAPVRFFLLAALLWTACGGAPESPDASPPQSAGTPAGPLWLVEAEVGIDFTHASGGTGEYRFPEIMGSGAALFDADGDGDLDAYLVNGALEGGAAPAPVNRFYRQEAGGLFVDATETSGLGDPGYGMGVVAGDVDNDGHVDLYLTNVGEDRLYRNLGDGTFRDVTAETGAGVPGWSTSATFLDFDGDGFLDLFVSRYVDYDPSVRCFDLAGRPDYCDPTSFPGVPDVLLRNLGDGTFRDVTEAAGLSAPGRAGLGVVSGDFDGDGRADLYVANDREANQLWLQQTPGRFVDEALLLGVSVNAAGAPEAGMGVVAEDLDGDGHVDFFVTHMAGESNTLYRNLGGGRGFEDHSVASGLAQPSMPFTGFGTAAADLDNDGDLDLLVANGRVILGEVLEGAALGRAWNPYAEPNLLLVNDGGRFEADPGAAGAFGREIEITRGLATGDVDGDGGIDVLVSNTEGPARLYRNLVPSRGHWLRVDAYDPRWRRAALGATIRLEAGGRTQIRTVRASSSYLSSSDPRVHFGLGPATTIDALSVVWPGGEVESFPPPAVDQSVRLQRGEGSRP